MTDTIETLKAALADMRRDWQKSDEAICEAMDRFAARVAAVEKAQKAQKAEEWEPPRIMDDAEFSDAMLRYSLADPGNEAARRHAVCMEQFSYLRRELARLWEGLAATPGGVTDAQVDQIVCAPAPIYSDMAFRMAREIQRHRALLKDGGGI